MAGTIPFSNPAGNNQTNPASGMMKPLGPTPIAGPTGSVPSNPYLYQGPGARPQGSPVPMAASAPLSSTTGVPAPPTSGSQGFITNQSSYANGQNDLEKQLIDIYGKGVGGSLFSLLNGMSGTNSTILQEFIASLKPQMAQSQANVNAALGAGGVSANSSVTALADANLQSQEFAAISGESAKLTQSQEELTAQLLSGMSGAAAKEVATSGWTTFADVMAAITQDAGAVIHGGAAYKPNPGAGDGFGGMNGPQIAGATSAQGDGSSIALSPDTSIDNMTIPFE